jgi:hypothetical protein
MPTYTPDPTTPVDINIFNYPVETPEAFAFWDSDHKCNQSKAFIAFCIDEANFEELAKRYGFSRLWRDRMWAAFGMYVNTPDMVAIPFTEIETPYWDCMPNPNEGTELEQPPQLVGQTPSLCEVVYNSTLTMSVVATGAPVVTYQWYLDDVLIPGATSTSYTVTPFTEDDNGSYHVVMTNPYGSTKAPDIIFETKVPAPFVVTDPVSQTITDTGTAIFTVVGSGYDTVQWYRRGIIIPGETTVTLSIPGNYADDGATYSAAFTNTTATVYTNQAKLTVTQTLPIIFLQPLDILINNGGTLMITADAFNYDSIQWFKLNSVTGGYDAVAGQTTTTYTEIVFYTAYPTHYYVEFTNINTTVRSRVAQVFVQNGPIIVDFNQADFNPSDFA